MNKYIVVATPMLPDEFIHVVDEGYDTYMEAKQKAYSKYKSNPNTHYNVYQLCPAQD